MGHNPEDCCSSTLRIFVAAKVLAEIFEQLRVPGVLGEIAAGAVLDPYALGRVRTVRENHRGSRRH